MWELSEYKEIQAELLTMKCEDWLAKVVLKVQHSFGQVEGHFVKS